MSSFQPTPIEPSNQHQPSDIITPLYLSPNNCNSVLRQNCTIVFGAMISVFCAAGLATGFSPLKTILLNEKVFSYLCLPNFNQQCQTQIVRLDLMYTLQGALGAFLVVPIGHYLDKLGPKYLYAIASSVLIVGLLLFALGLSFVEDVIIFAFIIISASGSALYTSSFHVANLFPKRSGMITLALNVCYDLSALVFTVVELIYSTRIALSSQSSFIQAFFCGYTVPVALVFLFGLFCMPRHSVAWVDPNKEEAVMRPISTKTGNHGISIAHLQSQLNNSPASQNATRRFSTISTRTIDEPSSKGVIHTHIIVHRHSRAETLQIGTIIDARLPALAPTCVNLPKVSEGSFPDVNINQVKLISSKISLINVSEVETNKHVSIAQLQSTQNSSSSKQVSKISRTNIDYHEQDHLDNRNNAYAAHSNFLQKICTNFRQVKTTHSLPVDQHISLPTNSKKMLSIHPSEPNEAKKMSMVKTGSSLQKRAQYCEGISMKRSTSSHRSPMVFSDAVPASIVQSMITHPYAQNESFDTLRLSVSNVNIEEVANEAGLKNRRGSFAIRPTSNIIAAASRSLESVRFAASQANSSPLNASTNLNSNAERRFSKNIVQMDVYAPKLDAKEDTCSKDETMAVNWADTTNMCLTLEHISIEKQYRSPFYWLFISHTIITVLLLNFQIGSINNQISQLIKKMGSVGSNDLEHSMLTAWSFILPIFGVAVSPLLLPLLQLCGHHSMFLTVSIVSITAGVVSLIETVWSTYALMVILSTLRPMVWTVACNYIGKVFGFGSFGRLYGSLLFLVGVTNFIVFGFNIMSLQLESYVMANAIVLSLQMIAVIFPAILYGWQKGFKTRLVTIDDESTPC